MPRWQDRGEVADSDDEDLCLAGGEESKGSEPPFKKLRLSETEQLLSGNQKDGNSQSESLADLDGSDDHDWLHKKPITTYGKGKKQPIAEPAEIAHTDSFQTLQSSPLPDVEEQPLNIDDVPFQDLRSSQDLQLTNAPRLQVVIPALDLNCGSHIRNEDSDSSGLSSPPSESDMSPPPDILFESLRRLQAAGSQGGQLSADTLTAIEAHKEEVYRARRNLRARQEKQLHPYLYDKTLYQQQFRSRGLKPVHYSVVDKAGRETHDESFNFEESQSQADTTGVPSSPHRASSVTLNSSQPVNSSGLIQSRSDDELPEIEDLVRRHDHPGLHFHKRRKLSRLPRKLASVGTIVPGRTSLAANQDELDGPLSPPLSSGDSIPNNRSPTSRPVGFRMPKGMTPIAASLPTPQISSGARPSIFNGDENLSFEEQSSQSPNTSTRRRLQSRRTQQSSPESSDPESETDTQQRQMQKVRRRIKGVLPASWLRIDLQSKAKPTSDSPPPSPRQPPSTAAPRQREVPTKGVAQRVLSRTPGRIRETGPIILSDLDEDSDSSSVTHDIGQFQSRLDLKKDGVSVQTPDLYFDDDDMEFDSVDQMLAGSSTQRQRNRTGRQPRITDAFRSARDQKTRFVDANIGTKAPRNKRTTSTAKFKTKSRRARPIAPRLSIEDAPNMATDSATPAPQFVRLAIRQARRQTDHGRHSPTHKVIRLATEDDTRDAYTVLSAWREGTIAQKQLPSRPKSSRRPNEPKGSISGLQRTPLHEIESNEQQRFPSPLRREHRSSAKDTSNKIHVRRPRTTQTQLHPIVLSDKESPNNDHIPDRSSSTPRQRNANKRQPRFQPQNAHYRAAQYETLEETFNEEHRTAAFERRIHCLTENISRRGLRVQGTNPQMERFFREDALPLPRKPRDSANLHTALESVGPPMTGVSSPRGRRRRRKPVAQRIDIEAREYRQPSEPIPDEVTILNEVPVETDVIVQPLLRDLGSFGTRYATDFDIQPLPLGTFFRQSTFIGSGDFATSLTLMTRDMTVSPGHIRIHIGQEVSDWGVWNEDVAASMSRIPNAIAEGLRSCKDDRGTLIEEQIVLVKANIEHMLRSTVRYCCRCLAFLDQVDRKLCVRQLQNLIEELTELLVDNQFDEKLDGLKSVCLQYLLVLAAQNHQLANHAVVPIDLKNVTDKTLTFTSRKLVQHIFPKGFQGLRSFYEASRHVSSREVGIKDNEYPITGLVLLNHVMESVDRHENGFWNIFFNDVDFDSTQGMSVHLLDKAWYNMFTALPALEMDITGVARPGSRFVKTTENWGTTKVLVDRVLALYQATSLQRGSNVNDYVRATLTRCHKLITRWGWWRCESVLSSAFDFFARRGLAQLNNEEGRGSPRFLTDSENQSWLEVQPEDQAFHIFLKMLAAGLQNMRKHAIYSNKKTGAIAWRFMPNHGRTYPKDAEVEQTDIDALRNHHDLLCTLYISTPPGHRPRIDLLRNLVDHNTSHREACRLNVRAWTNLASFQAGTSEPTEALEPLTTWFREMMRTTIAQYRMARTEAERDFATAREQGTTGMTEEMMNSVITSNQRQIAATIIDGLAGLKRALKEASSATVVFSLVEGTCFWDLFLPFDPSEKRLSSALEEALEITKIALEAQRKFGHLGDSQRTDDDSQEYGDSSALQELAITQNDDNMPQSDLVQLVHSPISQLASNLLGADVTVSDALLTKTIDVWVQVAKASVQSGKRTWNSYVDEYGSDAWSQLRDTDQKRKFTSYFLARIVEDAGIALSHLSNNIMVAWLTSLVEREAMLKYQHLLTSAILNNSWDDPLLDNLPFMRDHSTNRFNVNMNDLRSRRLGLISSVLCNMRDDYNDTIHQRPYRAQEIRKVYGDLLRRLMQAMKSNYQELQASGNQNIANASVQGSYVEFVQHIVGFFQQYTADICRIDQFFTDSSAFPLPAGDPTYVVGRIRSYVSKLADKKTQKQLAVFIHTVGERAAVDSQHPYLVEQLCTALNNPSDYGHELTPSLRHVMLTAIFPAYLESALSIPCCWILALPIFQACTKIFEGLVYCIDLNERVNVDATIDCVNAIIQSIQKPLEWIVLNPQWLRQTHTLRILALAYDLCRSMLTICNFLDRNTSQGSKISNNLSRLCVFANDLRSVLDDPTSESLLVQFPGLDLEPTNPWAQTREFAENQVRSAVTKDWYVQRDQYFVRRGNVSKEIIVSLDDVSDERENLLQSLLAFKSGYEQIIDAGGSRWPLLATREISGVEEIVV